MSNLGEKRVALIGDVHGCFDELLELVDSCAADHLVFVGDMINKGPKSIETLAYIRALPNATFIRGNHEDAVLQAYFCRQQDPSFKPHLAWVDGLTADDVKWLVALPFTISLPEHNAIVVHAGLVPHRALADQRPHHMTTMRNLVPTPPAGPEPGAGLESGVALEASSAESEGQAWAALWPGPEHVYFGHDAKRGLQQQPHATGLDTGCVYGKCLTAVVLPERRLVSVPAKAVHVAPGVRQAD